ncbi:MAG: branched-chain amino acid ABC transporter permease [Kiritimatiellae bacterium]|nr:branched-chain amino acid ABC transporter permease [Kiritimatiellia bacterium]
MSQFLQYVFSGLTIGGIYAIVGIGFSLIYSTTRILNFAQGEFVVLGGMTAVTFSRFVPLPLGIFGAAVVGAGSGAVLELLFFRRLRTHSVLHMVVITIGLSIVMQEAMGHIWDEKVRSLPYFTGNECTSVRIFGAAISPQVFWVLGAVAVLVLSLHLFLRYTLAGRAMRACSSNPEAAALAGINTRNMRTLAFCVSAGIGAVAGCVISPISMTQYNMGSGLAIKGFAAAILGGIGNPMAAVIGGIVVGLAEAFSVGLLPPGYAAYKDATSFAILLFALFVRPYGLLGSRLVETVTEQGG